MEYINVKITISMAQYKAIKNFLTDLATEGYWDKTDFDHVRDILRSIIRTQDPSFMEILDEDEEEASQKCKMDEEAYCHGCGDCEKEVLLVDSDEYKEFKTYFENAYKVGDTWKNDVAAPGIGYIYYKITHMSEERGMRGVFVSNNVREMEPWEAV